jgi:hypothetical protein
MMDIETALRAVIINPLPLLPLWLDGRSVIYFSPYSCDMNQCTFWITPVIRFWELLP